VSFFPTSAAAQADQYRNRVAASLTPFPARRSGMCARTWPPARCALISDGAVARRADPEELRAELLALPGIDPWTADYVVMRVLRAPDVLLADDVAGLTERAQAWRPWLVCRHVLMARRRRWKWK
jgi:hypothetical protein